MNMTINVLFLGLGLLLLIASNIVLGSIDAMFTKAFDPTKFKHGIIKGGIVALCFAVTYAVGWMNPDVLAVTINGQSVNLLTAVYLVIMAGFLFYAKEVIVKLTAFVNGKLDVGELTASTTTPADRVEGGSVEDSHSELPATSADPPMPKVKETVGCIGFRD